MTAAIQPTPVTVGGFLFGAVEDTTRSLSQALEQAEALPSLVVWLPSAAAHKAAVREAAGAIADLVDFDLVDVLVAGWRKHAALTAAARRTLAAPGSTEVVDLATHRVTSTHRPWVDVVVGEVHVAKLDLEVYLELLVKVVVAVVRHGRLVDLRFLRCDVAASLSVEGIEVARKDGALDPSLVAGFGDGIPLTPDPATTPPESLDRPHGAATSPSTQAGPDSTGA